MAAEQSVSRAATWHRTAEEVSDPADHLTLSEVVRRTGLAAKTITYAMHRTDPTGNSGPITELTRPAYRYRGEPRWSEKQVSDYFTALQRRDSEFTERYGDLPTISADVARQRDLVTLREISRLSGFALTTVHRWSQRGDFPSPVALVGPKQLPSPRVMRPWKLVRSWFLQHHPDRQYPERPTEQET